MIRTTMRRRALAGLVASTALLSGCWTQVGFDSTHRNHNDVEDGLTAANVATLDEAWSVEIPGTPSEPMVSGGRVFVARTGPSNSDVGVRALGVGDGAMLWDRELIPTTSADVFGVPVAVANGGLAAGYFGVLDAGSVVRCGTEHGTISTADGSGALAEDGILVSPPVSVGSLVVQTETAFASPEGFCLSGVLTLRVRNTQPPHSTWFAEVPGSSLPPASVSSQPTVGGERIFVANGSMVSAFGLHGCSNLPQCPALWSIDLGPTLATASPVAGEDGTVIVATTTGDAIVLDGATGAELWRTESAPGSAPARLALAEGVLYVAEPHDGSNGNFLRAFDANGCGATSCPPLWWASSPPSVITSNPVVAGDVVYLGLAGRVAAYPAHCTEPTCPPLTTVTVQGDAVAISVAQGRLFVSSPNRLTAFAP